MDPVETIGPGSVVVGLELTIRRSRVERLMGYPPGPPARGDASRRVLALWDRCAALLDPKGVYRFLSRSEAVALGLDGSGMLTAIGVATIGPALEGEVFRLSGENLVDALVVDAFGSAATEAALQALEARIRDAAGKVRLVGGPRAAPGLFGWDVSRQADLIGSLPACQIGVELTDGAMLRPVKSASLAVGFSRYARRPDRTGELCERCSLEPCANRRTGRSALCDAPGSGRSGERV
jgi:hypothetical protein